MQVKQRIMKGETSKNRYNLQSKNCDSTPGLPLCDSTPGLPLFDKQNNINLRNHDNNRNATTSRPFEQKPSLEVMRSMEIPKRLRTSANQQGLKSSQELFHFRQRVRPDRHESATFSQHLTFGEASRRPMMTSREFQQQKALKNQVIDELISNARRELCKSFNEFSGEGGSCANHAGKKAKYRLVSELSEGEEEMFYCSKCAINLLQQGFPIEEIKHEQQLPSAALLRSQQVTKFQLKLRALEERTRSEAQLNERKEELEMLQEEVFNCNRKFGEIFERLEAIRKDRIAALNATYAQLQSQKRGRRQGLQSMLLNMGDLQRQIQEYRAANRFASMRQNQFQFLATALTNQLATFQQTLAAAKTPSPTHRLSLETATTHGIIDRLKHSLDDQPRTRREQVTFQRREGVEEQFGCDQLKKPFRVLFPAQQGEEKRSLLSSVRQCPSFGQYP